MTSIQQESSDSMSTCVIQIIRRALPLRGTGFAITDEWTGALLLAEMPVRFSPMIIVLVLEEFKLLPVL